MFSRTNLWGLVALSALLAGCASSAPPLPADTTSINRASSDSLADFSSADQALTCLDIAAKKAQMHDEINVAEGLIYSNQTFNQATLYVFGPYLVPLFGMFPVHGNDREKADLSAEYARLDTLIRLEKVRSCRISPELEHEEMAQGG